MGKQGIKIFKKSEVMICPKKFFREKNLDVWTIHKRLPFNYKQLNTMQYENNTTNNRNGY